MNKVKEMNAYCTDHVVMAVFQTIKLFRWHLILRSLQYKFGEFQFVIYLFSVAV